MASRSAAVMRFSIMASAAETIASSVSSMSVVLLCCRSEVKKLQSESRSEAGKSGETRRKRLPLFET